MKKIMAAVACVLVFGLIGCTKQPNPEVTAQRDYKIASAEVRPKCPECSAPSKFGTEQRSGDYYK